MEQIDWDKAPEGATHWQPENSKLLGAWFKIREGSRLFKMQGQKNWLEYDGPLSDLGEMIERPSAWPGTGLPPVGTVCEHHKLCGVISDSASWQQVKIIAHITDDNRISPVAVYMPCGTSAPCVGQSIAEGFRPIRTPEQIAEDLREDECERMVEVINASPWGMTASPYECAALLYDYGYRKFEIVPE